MNMRMWASACGLAVAVWCAFGAGRAAEEPARPAAATAEFDLRGFDLRYSEASLRLAEVELEKVEVANRRIPGTFSPAAVEPLRQAVALARRQLDQARADGQINEVDNYIASAEAAWKIAISELQRVKAAQQRSAGSVEALEIERLQHTAELAELRYERALNTRHVADNLRLRWQVEQLTEDMLRLRARVEALTRRN